MGKIKQGTTCTIEGCNEAAIRSFGADRVIDALRDAGPALKPGRHRRAYLCQEHYKVFKKQRKQEKKIDKWRYGG